MGLVYNATDKKVQYLLFLDDDGGGSGGQPIIINLDYMQDTEPSNPQEKDVWYNTSNDELYTYKNGQWVESDPSVGVWYKFGNQYYLWDGDSLEVTDLNIYEKIENKTDDYTESSSIKYPSSKALSDGLKSVEPNLYDIKILSQAVAEKGWAFQCKTSRQDLAKADVPTLYQDIKDKYDNADSDFVFNSSTPTTTNGVWYCETKKKYYYANNGHIYESANADLSSPTDLGEFNVGTGIIIGKNINVTLSSSYSHTITIYDKNWELISSLSENIKIQSNNYKVLDGYILLWYSAGHEHFLITIKDDENNPEFKFSANLYNDNNVLIRKVSDIYDGYIYIIYSSLWLNFLKVKIDDLAVAQSDFGGVDTSIGQIANGYDRITLANIVFYDGYFYLLNVNKIYKSQTMMNGTWSEVETLTTNGQFISVVENDGTYYIATNGVIYTTTDFSTFNTLTNWTEDAYGYNYFNNFSVSNPNVILSLKESVIYVYGEDAKTVSTDTYVINGNEVEIDYYTKDGFKICIKDGGTNDTNLATVYSYMGYYNYFVLDTTGETVSLPRNNNLYSAMYVGDDFQDTIDGITGNATRLLPQAEIIEDSSASVSLDVKGNKDYQLTASALTALTLSSCEDSQLGTTIRFTSGATATTITDSASIDWVDGATPIPSASKTCLIFIWNKIGFYKEW